MLLHLVYPVATNALAVLRLLAMSHRGKDVETLALRRQLLVLQHQVAKQSRDGSLRNRTTTQLAAEQAS